MPDAAAGLVVHETAPLNAEPPLARLATAPLTPAAAFYIRSHGTIPRLDPDGFRLAVEGRVARPLLLGLEALRGGFPQHRVVATLQCAGNRRAELSRVRPVEGAPWSAGAIGTAEWAGPRLADLLHAAGCDAAPGLHAAFEGADEVVQEGRRFAYGGSLPLERALAPEVLLATAMNGAPLRPEHGFPLRLVVPGVVGARSLKWLRRIRVQDAPSDNHYQRDEYRLLPPGEEDPAAGVALQDSPVTSAICAPEAGADLPAGRVALRGYALSGGRRIVRVELTADDGRSWVQAGLEAPDGPWAWTLWRAALDLPPGPQEIAVRAWDEAAQTQPERLESVWNRKGYVNTAWHRIRVTLR